MQAPIECGDLPRGACAQMGAIAFFVPLVLIGGAFELLCWLLWSRASFVPLLLASLVAASQGIWAGLWVRARFQASRESPSLLFVPLWLPVLFIIQGFSLLVVLRVLAWTLAMLLGVLWLPKAIWKIGSMC